MQAKEGKDVLGRGTRPRCPWDLSKGVPGMMRDLAWLAGVKDGDKMRRETLAARFGGHDVPCGAD